MTARRCFDRGEEVGIPSPAIGALPGAKMCGIDDPYVFVAIVIAMTGGFFVCVVLRGLLFISSFSGGNGKDD